ncbi:MAG: arginine deiminase [Bacteroidales bacterium]|jgi:arginine deiminase|nr:arginine deiminase [Bacteroidales bacterium]
MQVDISSEIGHLEEVILHTPGAEIEKMTPKTIKESLYSDILSCKTAQEEYSLFEGVLRKWTKTHQIKDLLEEILKDYGVKKELIKEILIAEKLNNQIKETSVVEEQLLELSEKEIAKAIIQGKENLLTPLYNLYFTRDASSTIFDEVLINQMKYPVRKRESIVMEYIFKYYFKAKTINPSSYSNDASTEGGDVLIAREDVLLLGKGVRSNDKGVEFLINHYAKKKDKFNILVQRLPSFPDSFIHLDMVFTFLDKNKCMVYDPLIMKNEDNLEVCHIEIDNGKVSFHNKKTFFEGLKSLNFELEPIFCGNRDIIYQEREQWHSGANFFCLGEGKIIGYSRNEKTIEALSNSGFAVLNAKDVCSNKENMNNYEKFVVVLDAAELPRGGGGARCMTMPIRRKKVVF